MLAQAAKFDWYQSTVQASDPQACGLVDALQQAWELTDWVPAKNLNGYTYGGAIVRGETTLAHLCWGGNTGINVKTTSADSPVLAEALRGFYERTGVQHLPTRVDACCDWVEEGLFDSLSAHLIAYAIEHRLAINQQGDWERGQARTLYIGSKDSPVRLVLYEKGYEQGGDAPLGWVRLEVRIRPKKEHRFMVSTWGADMCFCAGWVPDALKVLDWDGLQKRAVGTVWRRSDVDRSRAALLKQYGRLLAAWAEEEGGWPEL
ncbi:replication initiation factor domain-containing protein, partial [Pseudomonas aeruginosa]